MEIHFQKRIHASVTQEQSKPILWTRPCGDIFTENHRLPAVPFWIVERAREQKTHSAARLERGEINEKRLGGSGKERDCAVTDAFEFPVAPATENSDWPINNSFCQRSLMSN